MNMTAIVVGALVAVLGVYLAVVQKKKTEGIVIELKFMKPVSLPEIVANMENLEKEGLAEGYRDMVQTNGKAVTEEEVTAPYSNKVCAYFEATVTREYEEEEVTKDKDGNTQRRRVRRSEEVGSQKSDAPLYLKDGDVKVALDLDGANLQLKDGIDRFEPYKDDNTYEFFGLRFTNHAGARTIGFRYKEQIIPLNHPLYVVGELRSSADELHIGKPSEKGKPFIISVKSKDEVTVGEENKAKMFLYGGIALVVAGIAIAIIWM
ncbi:MAG: E3 ubiquitin ligase family protein [Synergistaceae bacterium]|nr:E3 ubiquitin ligase family protein [Synergistaceae bacterium]MEA4881728.1 E3 ubiquitin ligase family protein [Synergistaceae bacterium]